eukprot:1867918-Amphidinium_carterae.1
MPKFVKDEKQATRFQNFANTANIVNCAACDVSVVLPRHVASKTASQLELCVLSGLNPMRFAFGSLGCYDWKGIHCPAVGDQDPSKFCNSGILELKVLRS